MATVRNRISANAQAATSTTFTFSETTPLDATHGIAAHVRRYSGTVDPTPSSASLTALANLGWTLLPGAGVTAGGASGQYKEWTGVFVVRGNGSINGIKVDGPAADTQIILVAVPNVKSDDWADLIDVSSSAVNVSNLPLGPVTADEDDSTVLLFIGLTGSAGGSGFTATAPVTMKGGTSQYSTSGWGEATAASGAVIDATVSWTTPSVARGFLLVARTAAPTAPVTDPDAPVTYPRLYALRSGQKWPARIRGVIRGGVEVPVAYFRLGAIGAPSQVITRDAHLWPFSATAPFNTAIATTATYESPTATKTAAFISKAGTAPAGGGGGQVNGGIGGSYGVTMAKATDTDPLITVTNTDNAQTVTIRIPTSMNPPTGTDMNTVVAQPDGRYAHEFYRFAWNASRTAATCTRIIPSQASGAAAYDLHGDGLGGGVRAAGIKLPNGLIRRKDLDNVSAGARADLGHALAMSIPKEYLGGPSPMYVWPANTIDNQANVPYSGSIPMGTLLAIPADVDLTTMGLSPQGLALGLTLQRYGSYVTDQSTTFALYVDQDVTGVERDALKAAWRATLMGLCRVVTNNTASTPGGGAPGVTRLAPTAPPFVGEATAETAPQTISLVGFSGLTVGTTTVSASYVAGATTDVIIGLFGTKPHSAVATNASYTVLDEVTNGTTAPGPSSGSVRCSAQRKTSSGTTASANTMTATGGTVATARTARFATSVGTWASVTSIGMADVDATGTTITATASPAAGTIQGGDMLIVHAVTTEDSANHDARSLTVAGCVLGTPTWLTKASTTTGDDMSTFTGYVPVLSGSSTGAVTYSATATVTGASGTAVEVVVLRD